MVLRTENKFVGIRDRRQWSRTSGRCGMAMVIMDEGRITMTLDLTHGGMVKEQETMAGVGVEEDSDQERGLLEKQFQVNVIVVEINILRINSVQHGVNSVQIAVNLITLGIDVCKLEGEGDNSIRGVQLF